MSSPRSAREIPQRYRLEGARCTSCERRYFPPRQVCPQCKGTSLVPVRLARQGQLLTWTVVHSAPEPFAFMAPYIIGIVELDDGVRLTVPIVDCESSELSVGARVRAVFRRLSTESRDGIIHYGQKFALLRAT